jgi:uncharacterized membrane protein YbhN (UPF0104 family)
MTDPSSTSAPPRVQPYLRPASGRKGKGGGWFWTWFWFLLKNVLGWALILGSFVVGPAIPGPGGIPVFLMGFALITFPGKRRATAAVLRGRPINPRGRPYRLTVLTVALLLPTAVLAWLQFEWKWFHQPSTSRVGWTIACAATAVGLLAIAGLHSGNLVNRLLATVPRVRRKVRPAMSRMGIELLPPRRRRRFVADVHYPSAADRLAAADPEPAADADGRDDAEGHEDETIIQIAPRHVTRMQAWWKAARRWGKRLFGVVVTVAIFVWILKPIYQKWDLVRPDVARTNWWRVLAASALFAGFLFLFRSLVWRRLLKNFGHKLPVWASTRIWITSELARYLPGAIWQVVGRVYLAKPYGVRGSVISTSQVMELALYLLANLMVAIGAMAFLGYKALDGYTRGWVIVGAVLVPLLSLALHPKVFYPLADRVLARLKKPPIQKRMRWKSLIDLLLWNGLGLLVQGLAVYFVVSELLDLKLAKWWVVAGAYCLAWCAGFLAFWAPGGLGVREAVFIAAMGFALPRATHGAIQTDEQRDLLLTFLSVLLRIWATAGELMLAGLAYAIDWKGATRSRAHLAAMAATAANPRPFAGTAPRPADPAETAAAPSTLTS